MIQELHKNNNIRSSVTDTSKSQETISRHQEEEEEWHAENKQRNTFDLGQMQYDIEAIGKCPSHSFLCII